MGDMQTDAARKPVIAASTGTNRAAWIFAASQALAAGALLAVAPADVLSGPPPLWAAPIVLAPSGIGFLLRVPDGALLAAALLAGAAVAIVARRPPSYWYLQCYLAASIVGEPTYLGELVWRSASRLSTPLVPMLAWFVLFFSAKALAAFALLKYFANRRRRFGVEAGWPWVDRLVPRWTRTRE